MNRRRLRAALAAAAVLMMAVSAAAILIALARLIGVSGLPFAIAAAQEITTPADGLPPAEALLLDAMAAGPAVGGAAACGIDPGRAILARVAFFDRLHGAGLSNHDTIVIGGTYESGRMAADPARGGRRPDCDRARRTIDALLGVGPGAPAGVGPR